MAILRSAPTPERLAEAWEQRFGPVLRRAAGRDGVLTRVVFIIRNVVWISRASPDPSPLVGWWKVGNAPRPS